MFLYLPLFLYRSYILLPVSVISHFPEGHEGIKMSSLLEVTFAPELVTDTDFHVSRREVSSVLLIMLRARAVRDAGT